MVLEAQAKNISHLSLTAAEKKNNFDLPYIDHYRLSGPNYKEAAYFIKKIHKKNLILNYIFP